MFNYEQRKERRLLDTGVENLSERSYNFYIGLFIFYGFLINALVIAFAGDLFLSMNMIAFLIGYIVLSLSGIVIACVSKNPIISFLGYNLLVIPFGALLSITFQIYLASDILSAVIVTGVVVLVMMLLSSMYPSFFAGLGRTLFIALLLGIVAEIVSMFLGYGGTIFDYFFVVLFSGYIGYDWYKAQIYPKTLDNAIDSAMDIYIDIINLFIRILNIIAKRNN